MRKSCGLLAPPILQPCAATAPWTACAIQCFNDQTDATRPYQMGVSFTVFACRSALFGHVLQRVPAQAFPEFGSLTIPQETLVNAQDRHPWEVCCRFLIGTAQFRVRVGTLETV